MYKFGIFFLILFLSLASLVFVQAMDKITGSKKPSGNFRLFGKIFNKVPYSGCLVDASPIMVSDWENSNYTIPHSVLLGKAYVKNLSAFNATPFLISLPDKDGIGIRVYNNTMLLLHSMLN